MTCNICLEDCKGSRSSPGEIWCHTVTIRPILLACLCDVKDEIYQLSTLNASHTVQICQVLSRSLAFEDRIFDCARSNVFLNLSVL